MTQKVLICCKTNQPTNQPNTILGENTNSAWFRIILVIYTRLGWFLFSWWIESLKSSSRIRKIKVDGPEVFFIYLLRYGIINMHRCYILQSTKRTRCFFRYESLFLTATIHSTDDIRNTRERNKTEEWIMLLKMISLCVQDETKYRLFFLRP